MSMTLISTVTIGAGGAASIDFNSIPATFTDLQVIVSGRSNRSSITDDVILKLNGVQTNQTTRSIFGNGSSAATGTDTLIYGLINGNNATSNTFGNTQFYIPNYAGSANKSVSVDSVNEHNSTTGYQYLTAGLWSSTAAITSISLVSYNAATLLQYSTASLYGITKGSGGATVS